MSLKKGINKVLLALILIEIILTAILVFQDLTNQDGFCVAGGCDSVQNSVYGKIFGVKLSVFGLASFLILLLIFIYERKIKEDTFLTLSTIGAAFATYFIYLQAFTLKQICSVCIVIDSTAILIFLLALAGRKERRWSIG
jgi:uncharacterized membrane protein